jgi:hypothetical protein
MPAAYMDFLAWVDSFLEKDKAKRFKQLCTLPAETVDSSELIFDELAKVYDAHDRNIKFDFVHSELSEDFSKYRETKLDDENFFKTKGFEALKTAINSFIVVDLPAIQETFRPEPYFYLLKIDHIIDIEIDQATGKVGFISFNQPGKRIVCIDEASYRTFKRNVEDTDWVLDAEAIHSTYTPQGRPLDGLGYCPVDHFYSAFIAGSGSLNKRGPLTSALGKFDWLLFWKTSKKYFDLYGAYPIIVSYKNKCSYRDEHGNECYGGYINYMYQPQTIDPNTNRLCAAIPLQKKCPVCEARSMIGPGSFWQVDPPQLREDADLMNNPVKIVEVGNDKLEYCVAEIERLENELYLNCVGHDDGQATTEAINEKQVRSQYESRKAVLNRIKFQLERAHKFALDTVARLRYGNLFLRSVISYGDDFFLVGHEKKAQEYAEAKKSGFPHYEIAAIREDYSRTKFKNNPDAYMRAKILAQIEPYPDISVTDLNAMQVNLTDPERFLLKLDFNNFVLRFERENINILEFGSLISPELKINSITKKLLEYVRQQLKEAAEPSSKARAALGAPGSPAGGNSGAK